MGKLSLEVGFKRGLEMGIKTGLNKDVNEGLKGSHVLFAGAKQVCHCKKKID